MGAPTACKEAGIPDVSYNGSTMEACPESYIISSKINWSPFYEYAITAVQNGQEFDTNWTGTLDTGSVQLTELNENVAAEGTAAKLEEVEAGLKDGSIHVFDTSTFTVDGKQLDSYLADVDADENYEHETEVISDGYFHESEYRSAPYFDLQIDGINLLDTAF
jgi:basic membrane protein A